MSQTNDAFGKPMYEADPTNARYNSLQLQCYEQRKEINRLNEHVTELENRLRALWNKLEYERKHYMEQIRRLEEAGNNLLWNFCPEYTSDLTQEQSDALKQWNQAKEAKP
jgi:predicted  nucleic acid-binding Zn-ribbon protein